MNHFQIYRYACFNRQIIQCQQCRLKDAGESYGHLAAMAKLHASETAMFVTDRAIQILGGYGYTTEYPVEKFYRDAKIGQIYEGTSNMQLLTIAKRVLADKLP